jgi:hypothetical protein
MTAGFVHTNFDCESSVWRPRNSIMALELDAIVSDFDAALKRADAKQPVAVNSRSKVPFQPGIGPHSESQTVELIRGELESGQPETYQMRIATAVRYPEAPRQRCDLCIGEPRSWTWAIEVKLLRFFGDNGKLNDNILMHILSPYPAHRSALTDCLKLADSSLGSRKAALIYGFDHPDWPLAPAMDAFAALAASKVQPGPVHRASFAGLVHRVHASGEVFGWEIGRINT